MQVQVASEASYRAYQGVDLITWGVGPDDNQDPAAPKTYRLLKSMTVADFTRFAAQQLDIDAELIRPWIMVNRQNGTVRPDHPLTWPDMTLQEAADKFSTRNSGFKVFLEETIRDADGQVTWLNETPALPSSPVVNGNINPSQHKPILIFLKYFNVERQVLSGVGHIYMNPLDKAQDLAAPILQMMGWEVGVSLELFEEIKQNYIEPMKPKNTLVASEIQDGDIICFQRHLTDAEQDMIKQTNPTASLSAPHYYDYLINRMFIDFMPRVVPMENMQVRNEGDESFRLAISKKDTYEALSIKVANHLSSVASLPVDPTHLRFTTVNSQSGKPRTVLKRQSGTTMANILLGTGGYGGYSYQNQSPDHLYYEVLEMSLTDLEQRKNMRITWLTEGITKEEPYDLLIHKQAQFTEVLSSLQKRAALTEEILDHIRFFEVHTNKVYKIIPTSQPVTSWNEFLSVFAERIPAEEKELDQERGDRLIYCFHFEREPSKSFGVPFIFMLKDGEVFKDTKERISKRTGIKGKAFEKIRFAVVKGGQTYSRPQWIEDGEFALIVVKLTKR